MSYASTVPAAKAALLSLLDGRAALAQVGRSWSYPGQAKIKREHIFLGRTRVLEQPATLGNRKRKERYRIEVVFSVLRQGDDPRATEERMWALVAELEDGLRADSDLSGVVLAAGISEAEQRTYAESQGRIAEAVVQVLCEARI